MPKPILTIKNLTKTYGQNVIFQHLDLTVNEGDTIVIIGPSGTGKSTLLRCVNLLTRPNEGQIWLDDLEITAKGTDEDKVRQHIGMVFQNFLLFNHLTALGNVKLGLTRVKKPVLYMVYVTILSSFKFILPVFCAWAILM